MASVVSQTTTMKKLYDLIMRRMLFLGMSFGLLCSNLIICGMGVMLYTSFLVLWYREYTLDVYRMATAVTEVGEELMHGVLHAYTSTLA